MTQLATEATPEATDLGPSLLGATRRTPTRLVRAPSKPGSSLKARRRKRDKAYAKRSQVPWVLATSLTGGTAEDIVGLYGLRMQIEETFRDLKSHRFGWSLRYARVSTPERWLVLLLIAMLATAVLHLVGRIAELERWHRGLQANTVTSRRVLSLVRLGQEVLRTPRLLMRLMEIGFEQGIRVLREELTLRAHAGPLAVRRTLY